MFKCRYVEVWHVPTAAQIPRTLRSQNEFLGTTVFVASFSNFLVEGLIKDNKT